MRREISSLILEDDNSWLKPFLRFDYDTPLTPEEWNQMMMVETIDEPIACDLPFAQLAANFLERNIILVPVLQTEVEKKTDKENPQVDANSKESHKTFLTIKAKQSDSQHAPLTMLYFPEGQFGPDAYFQSINSTCIDKTVLKNRALNNDAIDVNNQEYEEEDNSDDEEEDNNDFNEPNVTNKGNSFNQVTVLTPRDPASTIIVNETGKILKKKLKRGKKAPTYEIAPGEGKKPEEWLREPSFDIDAFPHLHPNGRYGVLDPERPKPITPAKYFPQRILNKNNAFAKDHDYVFMAQAYLERYALERQIDMAMLQGTLDATDENEIKMVPSDDKFSIFQSIPGTPAYWKKFRNEIYARMEQLGPFHLFYTLSCAELRWPSVLAEVLRTIENNNIEICYPDGDWDGSSDSIIVKTSPDIEAAIRLFWEKNQDVLPEIEDQINLTVYKKWYLNKKKISMRDLVKDHFILITRIFDKRVKDFHTEVLKKKGIVNYCYRVEFQMRGLPHIHGVAWLDKEKIKDCIDDEGLFSDDRNKEKYLKQLIDEWISCDLKFGFSNQEKDIKKLSASIKGLYEDKRILSGKIADLKDQIKDIQSQINKLSQKPQNVKKNNTISQLKKKVTSCRKERNSNVKKLQEKNKDIIEKEKEKDDKRLNDLVRQVNSHHHTNSCRKYKTTCRYDIKEICISIT